jgi:alanine-synthesizing transaminase
MTEAHVAVAPGSRLRRGRRRLRRIALVENEQRLRQAARGVKKMLGA